MERGVTVPIADPALAKRVQPVEQKKARDLTREEVDELTITTRIINARERYENDRKGKEREWTESYKMYMSFIDQTLNPFLSNLFIPKTHEAVELLSAFLIGTNQSISASPEAGEGNDQKAMAAGKWLEFLWRKVIKARIKILIWIKGGIVFGNGILNLGWDNVKKQPWMSNCAIEDVYFDYFEPDLQESELVIYEVRRELADVISDEKYDKLNADGKPIRENVIVGGQSMDNPVTALFMTFDRSLVRSECKGKVLVMEAWTLARDGKKQKLITLLPTQEGWRIARNVDNPNHYKDGTQFRPFSKLRFKTSPVPSRAYDTGAVWPTINIQKAFNDLMREYMDSVVLINAPMWIKRRGARINPAELVRRPGGVVTVSDISKDLKSDSVNDVKQSMIEMLNRLDREFQEASMVVNLLKGMSQSDTATGDAISQDNVQTLLNMIDQNIVDALSEVGQMAFAISANNLSGTKQNIKLYENDKETGVLEFDPANIDGMHDINIKPDRSASNSKAVLTKQLLDFLKIVGQDEQTMARYPNLRKKIYTLWLDKQGIGNADFFFSDEAQPVVSPLQVDPNAQVTKTPGTDQLNTDEAIKTSIMKAAGVQ